MKGDAVLQYASGPHVSLLKITQQKHALYAARNGVEYRVHSGSRLSPMHPYFDKLIWALKWLEDPEVPEGSVGVWLDADACWIAWEFNLCGVLPPEKDLGLVLMNAGWYNTGVIHFRKNERTIAFFKEALRIGAGSPPPEMVLLKIPEYGWYDQGVLNFLLYQEFARIKFIELEPRFNFYPGVARGLKGSVVVQAWHAKPFKCCYRSMVATGAIMPWIGNAVGPQGGRQ